MSPYFTVVRLRLAAHSLQRLHHLALLVAVLVREQPHELPARRVDHRAREACVAQRRKHERRWPASPPPDRLGRGQEGSGGTAGFRAAAAWLAWRALRRLSTCGEAERHGGRRRRTRRAQPAVREDGAPRGQNQHAVAAERRPCGCRRASPGGQEAVVSREQGSPRPRGAPPVARTTCATRAAREARRCSGSMCSSPRTSPFASGESVGLGWKS